jgi:hypothetical protein
MTARPKRRWFQFGLSSLFVLVAICALLSSAKGWLFAAFGLLAFGFWQAAYREDNPRLGVLVLIGLYLALSCIGIAFTR